MNANSNDTSMEAHWQWATRPDDERYLTVEDLRTAVLQRKEQSWTVQSQLNEVQVINPEGTNDVVVAVKQFGKQRELTPTHWGIRQLASWAGAGGVLPFTQKLPPAIGAVLTALNLQAGLDFASKREDGLILGQENGVETLRAVTSPSYGRIWDIQVVDMVIRFNQSGLWQVPAASYSQSNPKRATTLYASDRDVFMFLVDAQTDIEVPGHLAPMHRGFIVSNSEVGDAKFNMKFFLYDRVCDNRIIWGIQELLKIAIRHTGGAPERFESEAGDALKMYLESSPQKIIDVVAKAGELEPFKDKKDDNGKPLTAAGWLQKRGFTKGVADAAVAQAIAQDGEARTLWQMVSGVTAFAKTIKHTDIRVDLEEQAGNLMKYAEKAIQ